MSRKHTATAGIFVAVFIATFLTASRLPSWGDAQLSCKAAATWLATGRPTIDDVQRNDVVPSPDGHRYSKYGLLPTLACMPAAWARARWGSSTLAAVAEAAVPAATGALCAVFLYLLALRLGLGRGDAALLSALLYFGSPVWVYARYYYGEAQQAVVLLALVLSSLWARDDAASARRRLVPGLMLGLAALAKPSFLVLAPLPFADVGFSGSRSWRRRMHELIWLTLGLVPGFLLFVAYNQLRYGAPLAMGYGAERDGTLGFSVPFWSGAYGLLFSSGKSVFLYFPLALVALASIRRSWSRFPAFTVAAATVSGILFVISAKWWAWSGDWAWGPRLIIPALPLLGLLAAEGLARHRRLTIGLGVLGIAINTLGVLVHYRAYIGLLAPMRKLFHTLAPAATLRDDLLLPHFVPELSPVVGHAWLLGSYLSGEPLADNLPWRSLQLPGTLPGAALPATAMDSLDLAFAHSAATALLLLAVAAAIVVMVCRSIARCQGASDIDVA